MADRPGQQPAGSAAAETGAAPDQKPRVLPPMPAPATPAKAGRKTNNREAPVTQKSATEHTMPIPKVRTAPSRVAPGTAAASASAAAVPAVAPAGAAPAAAGSLGSARTAPVTASPGRVPASRPVVAATAPGRKPRRARLRLTRIDPWSVMKTAFLLSIALGVVTVVSVMMVWAVLGAAGLWDSINTTVQSVLGGEDAQSFDVTDYVGLTRVLGFTTLVAVVDVVLLTAIATLAAFLYNMAAALLGGIDVTLTEDHS